MSPIEKVYNFLNEAGVYYLATVEGDQPRVRPFGTINIFEGKLYIQTGKVKPVSKQIAADPKVELSCFDGTTWLRLSGTLVNDDRIEPKIDMLVHFPELKSIYAADDDNTQVLYFKDAKAVFSTFTAPPKVVEF